MTSSQGDNFNDIDISLTSQNGDVDTMRHFNDVTISVTRWQDFLFYIWPFAAMKIWLRATKIFQNRFKILPNT